MMHVDTSFMEKVEWGEDKKPGFRLNYPPSEPNVTAFSRLFLTLRQSSKMMLPPLGEGFAVGFVHIKFPGEAGETIEMIHSAAGITVVFEAEDSRDYIFQKIKHGQMDLGDPNYE